MNQISAADRMVILAQEGRWQLAENRGEDDPLLLLDVTGGKSLRYNALFGSTRRLPSEGSLTFDQVERVVLGWSAKDESWHLGLVMQPELATQRNSRWCEICRWPDSEQNVFLDVGTQAGETLAEVIGCPFNLIAPKDEAPSLSTMEQGQAGMPAITLPLRLGEWKAISADGQAAVTLESDGPLLPVELKRGTSWAVSRVTRIAWYSAWIAAYLLLSFTTFTRVLALPNSGTMLPSPQLLPFLGIGTALVLIGLVIYLFYELLSKPNRILIDPASRTVTALRGNRKRWQVNGGDVQSIYVTQVVGKKGKNANVEHGEINLHFGGNKFLKVVEQDEFDSRRPWSVYVEPGEDGMAAMTGAAANTEIETIGLYVARALGGLPCWYDQRGK